MLLTTLQRACFLPHVAWTRILKGVTTVETKHEAFQLLLDSCPDFRSLFQEACIRFYGENPPEAVNTYAEVGWLMAYLIDMARQQQTECFPSVFALIENLLLEGSYDVQTWAAVGVLEGVQNQVSHTDLGYGVFEPWLGPETRKAWDALIEAWGG